MHGFNCCTNELELLGIKQKMTKNYLLLMLDGLLYRCTRLLTLYLGGKFEFKNHKTEYVGGSIYMKEGFGLDEFNMRSIRDIVKSAQRSLGFTLNESYSLWHRILGRNLTSGRKKIADDFDFQSFFLKNDAHDRLVLYVVDEPKPKMNGPQLRCKNPFFWQYLKNQNCCVAHAKAKYPANSTKWTNGT